MTDFTQIIESVVTLAQDIQTALHTAYIKDGAIYGDSQEDMVRWINEKDLIARLRDEADRLEQYQAGMRVFRRQLTEKKNGGN